MEDGARMHAHMRNGFDDSLLMYDEQGASIGVLIAPAWMCVGGCRCGPQGKGKEV